MFDASSALKTSLAVVGIILLALIILFLMDRNLLAPDGTFGFWSGDAQGQYNSQRLFDIYTLTHITHGLAFYFLLWLFFPRMPVLKRLLLAAAIEAGWEIFENTELIINRYRESTIARGYYGDSILNVFGDILVTVAGFWIAMKIPAKFSVLLFLILELALLFLIRDNLILNVVTLTFPHPAIINWQSGL